MTILEAFEEAVFATRDDIWTLEELHNKGTNAIVTAQDGGQRWTLAPASQSTISMLEAGPIEHVFTLTKTFGGNTEKVPVRTQFANQEDHDKVVGLRLKRSVVYAVKCGESYYPNPPARKTGLFLCSTVLISGQAIRDDSASTE